MAKSYLESLLGKDETILFATRQHWLLLMRANGIELLIAAAIVIGSLIAAATLNPLALAGFALALIPLAFGLGDFLNWWHRRYVVTSRRVVQIYGVFNKNVIDSSLEKVNDVKMEQSVLGRMLNFGDIEILTASELGVNLFQRISDPIRFKTTMLDAKARLGEESEAGGWAGERAAEAEDVPSMIAKLDQLRKQGILSEEEFTKKKAELLAKI
jgi:uncharacterized membrane protein YdbT with pleckstrin-like domain